MQAHPRKASAGFNLLELMIVVMIVAILAAIAIPNYLHYSLRSRRTDAMAALALNQAILERCYAAVFDYTQVNTAPLPAGCAAIQAVSPNNYYAITLLPAPTTSTYTLTATAAPGSPQLQDTACVTLSVTSTNKQLSTGSGTTATCWSH
jgi:type IV pilus assembly protein PilE